MRRILSHVQLADLTNVADRIMRAIDLLPVDSPAIEPLSYAHKATIDLYDQARFEPVTDAQLEQVWALVDAAVQAVQQAQEARPMPPVVIWEEGAA